MSNLEVPNQRPSQQPVEVIGGYFQLRRECLPVDRTANEFLVRLHRAGFFAHLQNGSSIKNAGRLCCMGHITLDVNLAQGKEEANWYEQGRIDELTPFAEMYLLTEYCRAVYQRTLHNFAMNKVKEDGRCWGFLMEVLARVNPEEYGRRETMRVEQDTKISVTVRHADSKQWLSGSKETAIEGTLTPLALTK
jgi:hypothetical protein